MSLMLNQLVGFNVGGERIIVPVASAPQGGTAANLVDGNTGTTCDTNAINFSGTPAVVDRILYKVDMGFVTTIDEIRSEQLALSSGSDAAGRFQAYYSTDDSTYTALGSSAGATSSTPIDYFATGSDVSARYIALVYAQINLGVSVLLGELTAYLDSSPKWS